MKTITILLLALWPTLWASSQNSLPNAELRDVDGNRLSASEVLQPGSPTLLVFWKSNNSQCCENLENLEAAWTGSLRDLGVRMIVICTDCDGNWSRVKPLVNGNGWEFETYVDVNGDLKRAMSVGEGPCTMLFDRNETMVCRYNAACTGSPEFICDNFKKHLGGELTADVKRVGR
jgi:hypothetical protein